MKRTKYKMLSSVIASLKRELREWYGAISVEELVNNRELAFEIEVLERMLINQGQGK